MTFQWGKNPDHTISLCINWDSWALPFRVSWWCYKDALNNKAFTLNLECFCFCIYYERWDWND